jgi:malate dehydrogenase (oxaloacetate-decarboxylating)(NADP+)
MSNKVFTKEEALDYHSIGRPGKIKVVATKRCETQKDLSLAYSPGVAHASVAIHENPDYAFKYTARGNLVAVVSNGTAVLGLGNIGPLASKPVMEGKGVLFKRFAGIDVFDIELNAPYPQDMISACRMLEPTFGGINLEDIKAPECFEIETELQKLSIPVFHDDQHGTAVIAGAALISVAEIVNKVMENMRVVINGAGASGLSIAKHILRLGIKKENLIMCDTKGVIYNGRIDGMNPYKALFASDTPHRTLAEAAKGADVLLGLSSKNNFTPEMVESLAKEPVIMALANPDPEIEPEIALKIRPDAIVATGRSDYPNQVNNVLCFPFIFRGALDVRATTINDEMKMAASLALAALAKEPITQQVKDIYPDEELKFGKKYIIPKPFDKRVLTWVSSAVAEAAMETGVARIKIDDMDAYRAQLLNRVEKD